MEPKKIMLVAGEASGDTLGAELIGALRANPAIVQHSTEIVFFGAGGPKMAAAGAELELDLSAHAVVGIWEVLKNYGKFKRFFDQLITLALARKPDVIILIDYPGFNLRFANAIKIKTRQGSWKPKLVYYVSPQIWAWHESRVHQIARNIDLLLSIFPFEKAWYAQRAAALRVEFVGHPLIDRFGGKAQGSNPISTDDHVIRPASVLLLPGSRVRELKKHLPVMLGAVSLLAEKKPVRVKMVLPNESLLEMAKAHLQGRTEIEPQVGGLDEALARADLAIASSGTVTMECAYFGVPTVVLYKTSGITYALGKRFIRVKYIAMPNLLSDSMIYPEFIQQAATPEALARAGFDLLNNPERRTVVKAELKKVIASLGTTGASGRAAQAVVPLLFPMAGKG